MRGVTLIEPTLMHRCRYIISSSKLDISNIDGFKRMIHSRPLRSIVISAKKSTVVEKPVQSINDVSEDEWLAIERAKEAKKRTQTVDGASKGELLVTKHAKEA